MDLSWMAWTWPTAAFFSTVLLSIGAMWVWEKFRPGGDLRQGILQLKTTRGDRLFISWLGTGFIHLGWLGLFGAPLWGALVLSFFFWLAVFKWV